MAFALEICNLPRITEFALKLRINSQYLSQSESSNFSQCVINLKISIKSITQHTMLLLTNCEVHTGKYLDRSFYTLKVLLKTQ